MTETSPGVQTTCRASSWEGQRFGRLRDLGLRDLMFATEPTRVAMWNSFSSMSMISRVVYNGRPSWIPAAAPVCEVSRRPR